MLRKIIGNKYGLLILGLVALVAGIYLMSQTEVKCGSDVMSPGDTCTTTRKGISTERTFDEQKSSDELSAKLLTGAGGVMTLGGAAWIIVGLVRRKPESESESETAPVAAEQPAQ